MLNHRLKATMVESLVPQLHRLTTMGLPSPKVLGDPRESVTLDFSSYENFRSTYLAGEFLSKYSGSTPNLEKEKLTRQRFEDAEVLCQETNDRLAVDLYGQFRREISLAIRICDTILGPFCWDQAAAHFDWGPGASTRLSRRHSDSAYKYSGEPETTSGNLALALAAIRHKPIWNRSLVLSHGETWEPKLVPGNKVVTVPKNYKVDRTIAIEPDMNMYVQKGIGALMRKRLLRAGCDLNDQTRNQRLAKVGSVSNRLATVDFSMASDTISSMVVFKFIRPDWFQALEQCRSPYGVLPSGELITYQKFSSMGNGYTFELESLIFYSIALAVNHIHGDGDTRVSVYGDDVIIPCSAVGVFVEVCRHLGFKTNESKTFSDGPFRESCGKHYYSGLEVTPFYIRDPIKDCFDVMKLHNKIMRYLLRTVLPDEIEAEFLRFCRSLFYLVPSRYRNVIPDGIGDGGFLSYDGTYPSTRDPDGAEGEVVKCFVMVGRTVETDVNGLLVKSLDRLERRDPFFARGNTGPFLSPFEVKEWLSSLDDGLPPYPLRQGRMILKKLIMRRPPPRA